MKTITPAFLAFGISLFVAIGPSLAAPAPADAPQTIRLNDGTVLRGAIVSENDSAVVVQTEELGRVTLKRSRISTLPVRDASAEAAHATPVDPDPIGHTLVLMPTAFLPPQGSVVFRDFQLLFLTLGYAPTASTSVVAGAMFPITADFNALTLGVKQGLYQNAAATNAVAVVGNVTVPVGREINEAGFLWLANLVGSHRFKPGFGVHAALGGVGVQGRGASEQSLSMAAGTDVRISSNVKFLGEVLRGGTSFDPGSSLTVANLGIRLHGDRLSADICALRPLSGNIGDFFVIPLINVGYRF